MKSRLLVAAVGVPLLFYIVLAAPPIVMMRRCAPCPALQPWS